MDTERIVFTIRPDEKEYLKSLGKECGSDKISAQIRYVLTQYRKMREEPVVLVDLLGKRCAELIERYTPDLDEAGVKYFREGIVPNETISCIFRGRDDVIQFLEDDELAKQLFKCAIERYNGLTGKAYRVNE